MLNTLRHSPACQLSTAFLDYWHPLLPCALEAEHWGPHHLKHCILWTPLWFRQWYRWLTIRGNVWGTFPFTLSLYVHCAVKWLHFFHHHMVAAPLGAVLYILQFLNGTKDNISSPTSSGLEIRIENSEFEVQCDWCWQTKERCGES